LVRKPKKPKAGGRIVNNYIDILAKEVVGVPLHSAGSGQDLVAAFCERGKQASKNFG
jgi:hypothetical protein